MPRTGSRIPPVGGVGVGARGAPTSASYVTVNVEAGLSNETRHSGIMHSGAYGGLGRLLNPTWTNNFGVLYNAGANRWDMVLLSGGLVPFSGACINASYLTRYAEGCLPNEITHSGIMHSGAYGGLGRTLNPTWTNGFIMQYNAGATRWDMVSPSGVTLSGYHSDWLSGVDGGRVTFNGDGSGTQFAIPHTLTRPLTNNDTWWVTPASSGAAGDFYTVLSGGGVSLLITYKTAPASGTNNVVLQWGAMKL